MASQRKLVYWIALLGALHGVVVCAGFFAPYDPEEQVRTRPYVPPMRIHFVDARGSIHLRPFVYDIRPREGAFDEYEEDTGRPLHLQFFVRGAPYRLLGILPGRLHLFGAGDARVYLLGGDGYGRDLLSRILAGGPSEMRQPCWHGPSLSTIPRPSTRPCSKLSKKVVAQFSPHSPTAATARHRSICPFLGKMEGQSL